MSKKNRILKDIRRDFPEQALHFVKHALLLQACNGKQVVFLSVQGRQKKLI